MNYIWWSDPMFNRTQSDIELITPKARLNASDLNRIEGNIGWLASRWDISLVTRKWEIGSLEFTPPHSERIIINTDLVKRSFHFSSDYYDTLLFWGDLNTIEKVLYDVWNIYQQYIDWDCWECQFDIWDDFDEAVLSWDYFENMIGCKGTNTWDWFEVTFVDWDVLEAQINTWDDLECKGVA